MPGYVMLMKWTSKGVADLKGVPERVKRNKEAMQKAGGKIVGVWFTMGEYDLLAIGDFPNDQAASAFALSVASQGNVTTTTMRALSEAEFAEVVAKLPAP